VSVPAGSQAAIVNPTSPTPVFRADRDGLYVAQLVVSDGALSSDPDTVSVSTTNTTPVARAGADLLDVPVDGLVPLDGTASSDADGQPLSFRWSLLSAPAGSAAALSDNSSATPTFVADRPGDYVAQLIVSDGPARQRARHRADSHREPRARGSRGRESVRRRWCHGDARRHRLVGSGRQCAVLRLGVRQCPDRQRRRDRTGIARQATFVADVFGDFVIRLTVTDGAGGSATADVSVHAAAPGRLDTPATLTWPALQIGGSDQRRSS
jgi:hypothetical protein